MDSELTNYFRTMLTVQNANSQFVCVHVDCFMYISKIDLLTGYRKNINSRDQKWYIVIKCDKKKVEKESEVILMIVRV